LRGLVLPQENSDVLLIPFLLEILEKRKNSLVAARSGIEEQVAVRGRQLLPRLVHRDPFPLRELRESTSLVLIARLRPRIDRTIAQRARRVGNHQCFVVLENRAEAVALAARTARIVE
jgi:hypothetical protein